MRDEPHFLDFLYIGTPRSGSTWLAACLNEHPEVFIPHNKEVHFFNDRHMSSCEFKYPKGLDYYREFFAGAPDGVRLGELSPYYYYDPNAAARVARNFPHVKIVAFLRNPADMLFSLYLLLRQRERRAMSFEEELAREPRWLDLASYHRLLTPWFDWFPAEQIWISCYESVFLNTEHEFSRICTYLDIDPTFRPDNLDRRINASTSARPNPLRQFRGDVMQILNHPLGSPVRTMLNRLGVNTVSYERLAGTAHERPVLHPDTRAQVMALLEPDLARLETFLGVNLDGWRLAGTPAAEARQSPAEVVQADAPAMPYAPVLAREASLLPHSPPPVVSAVRKISADMVSFASLRRRDRPDVSTAQATPTTIDQLYHRRLRALRTA